MYSKKKKTICEIKSDLFHRPNDAHQIKNVRPISVRKYRVAFFTVLQSVPYNHYITGI